MYKYTVEAFNESDMGKLNMIHITVQATNEAEAIERAKAIKERTTYAIIGIEDLSTSKGSDTRPEIKKG